jgi:hypothetical protein
MGVGAEVSEDKAVRRLIDWTLWAGTPDRKTDADGIPRPHVLGWRWALKFEVLLYAKEPLFIYFGLNHQVQEARDGRWHDQSDHYVLSIRPFCWRLNSLHHYYGPHCMWSLGPFHVTRATTWCRKCMPEGG